MPRYALKEGIKGLLIVKGEGAREKECTKTASGSTYRMAHARLEGAGILVRMAPDCPTIERGNRTEAQQLRNHETNDQSTLLASSPPGATPPPHPTTNPPPPNHTPHQPPPQRPKPPPTKKHCPRPPPPPPPTTPPPAPPCSPPHPPTHKKPKKQNPPPPPHATQRPNTPPPHHPPQIYRANKGKESGLRRKLATITPDTQRSPRLSGESNEKEMRNRSESERYPKIT